MTARIRALKYPHLCYLPPLDASKASSDPGSILRLDMTFASYLCRGSDPHEYRVKDEVMDVIKDQLKIVCGMAPSDDFLEIKELVDECLVK